jgi:hypothetical protein
MHLVGLNMESGGSQQVNLVASLSASSFPRSLISSPFMLEFQQLLAGFMVRHYKSNFRKRSPSWEADGL